MNLSIVNKESTEIVNVKMRRGNLLVKKFE